MAAGSPLWTPPQREPPKPPTIAGVFENAYDLKEFLNGIVYMEVHGSGAFEYTCPICDRRVQRRFGAGEECCVSHGGQCCHKYEKVVRNPPD